ncbi:uncharacterized protein LOC126685349 [Mercurialis annua]|uniref:uncharacterized protein LOC126685349 n=1 Tax=Mercurialis annua TaxID=3986 RepID=UPI00216059B2|nr:uncharacterized protein LOC126685349 [Mercurialis annua]
MKLLNLTFLFHFLLLAFSGASADHDSPPGGSTIIFGALGSRDIYSFDIFTLPAPSTTDSLITSSHELQITDAKSFNFNGHFPSPSASASLLSLFPNQTLIQSSPSQQNSTSISVVYATERDGSPAIYFDVLSYDNSLSTDSRSALEFQDRRIQIPLLKGNDVGPSFKDKPSLVGDYLIYVSTHEDPGKPRASWAAVYSTELKTGSTRRLTPNGIADFSPSVSPSGVYTAVASYGERGWNGEVEVLTTDIYVFLTRDGSQRVRVVENGGWPTWVDESTLYFHRRNEADGWISIYRAILPTSGSISTDSVIVERVTPPGIHAFTPATSPGNNKFIAVATRRTGSDYRHIELFDLVKNEFIEFTRLISPKTNHFNPFISPDSGRIGYHRCRSATNGKSSSRFMLENLKSPAPEISLFRIDGWFPSWSPGGDRIALAKFPGLYVVNPDGSDRRQVYPRLAFPTIWDPVRPGIIYSSTGPAFGSPTTEVDIIAVNVDEPDSYRKLTTNRDNNAFPAVSPDGKWIVFRSGISGYRNLYLMDPVEGEKGGLIRLTEGPWDDTMADWSSDGEWIVFCSDRADPGAGSFDLYLIHPNGTGLTRLFTSGPGGRSNHPYFSPDGKSIVFTTDYAGLSAEPISNQHMYQPYGEIYIINVDGSGLKRLTHNSFEDGTPAWGPKHLESADLVWPKYGLGSKCSFKDAGWTWLKKHSLEVESLASSTVQCGA